jgi:GYF domain 2
MAEQYYFARDNAQFGPFTAAQMRDLAAKGRIQPTDSVWLEGTERKILAAQVKNLFAAPAPQAGPSAAGPSEGDAAAEQPQAAPPREAAEAGEPATPFVAPAPERARPPAAETTGTLTDRPAFPPKARPKRVVSIRGGILAGQDGEKVQFRKQCEKCGFVEPARTTTTIRVGTFRVPFFCPKCRRGRTVELTGIN